jgi:hypothetical protein
VWYGGIVFICKILHGRQDDDSGYQKREGGPGNIGDIIDEGTEYI